VARGRGWPPRTLRQQARREEACARGPLRGEAQQLTDGAHGKIEALVDITTGVECLF
jgi:hypothetical protein